VGDRPVHLDDRSRRGFCEHVVESRDPAPVGVLGTPGAGVLGGDRRLEEVPPHRLPARGQHLGLLQCGQSAADLHLVPPAPVLGLQQDRHPMVVDPSGHPRPLDLQQRLEPEHLDVVGRERHQHPGQPHRLVRQVRAHPVPAGGGGVALVEDQVDHGHHVVDPSGALGPRGEVELGVSRGQGLLRSRDALTHGRLRDQEPPGDLRRRESPDQTQRQRGTGLRRQGGVAGQEDES
jgi:hypothetical protein